MIRCRIVALWGSPARTISQVFLPVPPPRGEYVEAGGEVLVVRAVACVADRGEFDVYCDRLEGSYGSLVLHLRGGLAEIARAYTGRAPDPDFVGLIERVISFVGLLEHQETDASVELVQLGHAIQRLGERHGDPAAHLRAAYDVAAAVHGGRVQAWFDLHWKVFQGFHT